MDAKDVQTMADAYVTCALFTEQSELGIPERSGEFDSSPHIGRVTKDSKAMALDLCTVFYHANAADLADYPADCAGHDLWYTRNGHGVGFWEADHCTKEEGERLTNSAKRLGEAYMFKGKGGWIAFEDQRAASARGLAERIASNLAAQSK